VAEALAEHDFKNARVIASANTSINSNEMRIAYRLGGAKQNDGWHIIYQLSDGMWASKNYDMKSVREKDITHINLWANKFFLGVPTSQFRWETVYMAVEDKPNR